MTRLEIAVLTKLFSGNHPVLGALLKQVHSAAVCSREMTGAGFFTYFDLPNDVLSADMKPGKVQFGDVDAIIPGLEFGAGFLVYIQDGRIKMLEGYSYDEPWPMEIMEFELRFSAEERSVALGSLTR